MLKNVSTWRDSLAKVTNGKCNGCSICDGQGCVGRIPGMGGLGSATTFINNYNSWDLVLPNWELTDEYQLAPLPNIGMAPVTGVNENIGLTIYENEFHQLLVAGSKNAGIFSCIGDGAPDYKLQSGIEALFDNEHKGNVFLKPYPNSILYDRLEWVKHVALYCGIDIDSHKIVTMANKTTLEKKSAFHLNQFKKAVHSAGLPFILKGISNEDDIDIVEKVRPDCVVVSNHGGRVLDKQEGIAFTLEKFATRIKKATGEVWVDGGIRTLSHLKKAAKLGASSVLIARPFIQATAVLGEEGIIRVLNENYGISKNLKLEDVNLVAAN